MSKFKANVDYEVREIDDGDSEIDPEDKCHYEGDDVHEEDDSITP